LIPQPIPFFSRRHVLVSASAALSVIACTNKNAREISHSSLKNKGQWSTAPSLPRAVQEIYPCAHQGRLHLAGGFNATEGRISGPTAGHHSWSPGEDAWRVERPLPKTGWALSEDGKSWRNIVALPAPAAEAVTGVTGDGFLHLAGGRTWATENQRRLGPRRALPA